MGERKITRREFEWFLVVGFADGLVNFITQFHPLEWKRIVELENQILNKVGDEEVSLKSIKEDENYIELGKITDKMREDHRKYRFSACGGERFQPQGDIINKSLSRPRSFGMGPGKDREDDEKYLSSDRRGMSKL